LIKIDVNYDPEKSEEEEYQSKMKQVKKVEEFRRQREEYRSFIYLFIIYFKFILFFLRSKQKHSS